MFEHIHSNSVYDFVVLYDRLFSCFIGSWPKETFATKGNNLLTIGHQN